LPQLREEIALLPGPRGGDGQPTWTLHDPTRNLFFRIDWQTFAILSHWHLDDPAAISAAIAQESTLSVDVDDMQAVIDFLARNELLKPREGESSRLFAQRLHAMRGGWMKQALHHYLFFRIPLVNPDAWLDRWAPRVAWIYTKGFLRLTLLALVAGLFLVYRNWDQFHATLVDTFSLQGLMSYGVAITAVKLLHELGHAFTAKRFGCRVPTMGVAFLVLWPVAYTDTNEVWKIPDARRRLAVAAAGLATETLIAIWATLAWALLPEGVPKSIAFVLATVSWFATLAINASPFMRFDGYYIVSDWLDMPNLHGRAFALARWDLRERLFALGEEPPEHFPRERATALILFAWATWIYRLVVFAGIAVLVYHFFIKAAGIVLFGVEVVWFMARPVWSEVKVWVQLWPKLRDNARARRSAAIAGALLLAFVIPWPLRVHSSALLKPADSFVVYAPGGSQVVEWAWKEGAEVPQGAVLVKLASPDLAMRWDVATAKAKRLRAQAAAAGVDARQRQDFQVLQQDLSSAEAEVANLEAEAARYSPVAPFAGRLYDLDPEAEPGVWVRKEDKLMTLVRPGPCTVETYLDEDAVRRVSAGDSARFVADSGEGPSIGLTVSGVDQDATRVLPSGILAVGAGGSVVTRDKDGHLVPEHAVYRVTMACDAAEGSLESHSWRGHAVISGRWEAPGLMYLRTALALLWREAGF
jgi:putative peptide zinc metalloprotease protein